MVGQARVILFYAGKGSMKLEWLAWWLLVRITRWWSWSYMDQWTKFKFETKYGTVYVGITREEPYPDSFDLIDSKGNGIGNAR